MPCRVVPVSWLYRPGVFGTGMDDDELREDGHGLEIDGESPEHLGEGEVVIDQQRQDHARNDDEKDVEGILVGL